MNSNNQTLRIADKPLVYYTRIAELKNFNLELIPKLNGREGVDFLIEENQLYLQSYRFSFNNR